MAAENCLLSKSFIGEIDKSYLPHVSTFIARHEPFKESLFDETYKKSPATWWKSGLKLGFDKKLCRFFQRASGIHNIFSWSGTSILHHWHALWQASKQFGHPKSRQNGLPLPATELSLNELLHFVMLMFYASLKNEKKNKISKLFSIKNI